MSNDEGMGYGMTGVGDSLWDWITGFYGGLSLIFLALIIVGIVLLVRDIRVSSEAGLTGDSPTASNRRDEVTSKAAPPRGNDTG
jgi:hypothetical protein